MSFFITKTLLAALFLAAGLTAALSMLTLMGRTERRVGVMALRNMHRIAGYAFATLLVLLAAMGLKHLSAAGDTLSVRGVLHWSLASLLLFVLALKLVVVRWFKQFLKFVPVMGMTVVTLALVVAMLSAVFFVVTGGLTKAEPGGRPGVEAEEGGKVFTRHCLNCHYDDSTDAKIGPGLAGLFARDTIAASGKRTSPETVREQILAPSGSMPSFEPYLSEKQLDDLITYLRTL